MRIRLLFGHGLKWGSVISDVEVHHSLFGLVARSSVLTVNAFPVVVWVIFPYQREIRFLVTAISMTSSGHSRNYDVWLPSEPTRCPLNGTGFIVNTIFI